MADRIVVFSGAGISAESGLRTFRDMGGYWHEFSIDEVASPEGWARNPQLVLDFYNERRRGVIDAEPNEAHLAVAQLEQTYDVTVVTQNIDDLHERAGSTRVVHLHGQIRQARSSVEPQLVYPIDGAELKLGQTCERGSQLRPHVVWFGESVELMEEAARYFQLADRVLVVGTSLNVYPAAGLVHFAERATCKYLVVPEAESVPTGYELLLGRATEMVPPLVTKWQSE